MTDAAASAAANAAPGDAALVEYLLRHADDRLILGHRVSEWCGHAPILEEDIALANIALDHIGQATFLLGLAAQAEGKGRSADDLAYWRDAVHYRNLLLVEQPNGDFAVTIARQFIFAAWSVPLLEKLAAGSHAELAGIAAKALKEDRYHLRHARTWVLRLGDGTAESKRRMQAALDELWTFTGELFAADELDREMQARGIAPDLASLRPAFDEVVNATLDEATLTRPDDGQFMASGGRRGRHSEHLGYILDLMQILPRSFPGASW